MALPLGFRHNGYTYMRNFVLKYVQIPTVGLSTRMHCIYQNLDNIYLRNDGIDC